MNLSRGVQRTDQSKLCSQTETKRERERERERETGVLRIRFNCAIRPPPPQNTAVCGLGLRDVEGAVAACANTAPADGAAAPACPDGHGVPGPDEQPSGAGLHPRDPALPGRRAHRQWRRCDGQPGLGGLDVALGSGGGGIPSFTRLDASPAPRYCKISEFIQAETVSSKGGFHFCLRIKEILSDL